MNDGDRGSMRDNQPGVLPQGLALVLLVGMTAFALLTGIATVRGLSWPYEADLLRDIGSAQALLDGRFGADPLYLDERAWYSPLVPALIAGLSALTGWDLPTVYAQAGAYLNILGPIGFAVLLWALFDGSVAVAGTAGYLFLVNGNLPGWVAATYSPWLFSVTFMQGPFFLALAAVYRLCRGTGSFLAWGAIGALGGVCFLGHLAPALLLGTIVSGLWIASTWKTVREGGRSAVRRNLLNFMLCAAVAFVVSLPLLASILFHYGLRIQNPNPSAWLYGLLTMEGLPQLWSATPNAALVLALVGVVVVMRGTAPPNGRRLLLLWVGGAALFFIWAHLNGRALASGAPLPLPALVPSFHFFVYLRAVQAVFFGVGFAKAIAWLTGRIPARLTPQGRRQRAPAAVLFVVFLVALVLPTLGGYRLRGDFVDARREALRRDGADYRSAYRWLLQHTSPEDVFVCEDELSLNLVAPAGRKLVATDVNFSNPYVDHRPRITARAAMLAAAREGQGAVFRALAVPFGVRYLLTTGTTAFDASAVGDRVFQTPGVVIYRVSAE